MRFLQGYANSAVCSASRLALITGRYQYRLRLGLEEPLFGNPEVGLPPEHPTLPSLLKKAGYGTTLIGKWHLGALPKFGPLKSGYDHFFGFRGEAEFGRDGAVLLQEGVLEVGGKRGDPGAAQPDLKTEPTIWPDRASHSSLSAANRIVQRSLRIAIRGSSLPGEL
jgi:arylsulfatase A-like enzyme